MVLSSKCRHATAEAVATRLGPLLMWVPFILVMTLSCQVSVAVGLWSAAGVQAALVALTWYRSRFNERVDPVMVLEGSFLVAYFVQAVVDQVVAIPCAMIGPINVSLLVVVALLSMALRSPFTLQVAKTRPHVTPEIASSAAFLRLNMVLTALWAGLFAAMATMSWCAYAFFRDERDAAPYILLSTVQAVALPVLGQLAMPAVVECLRGGKQPERQEGDGCSEPPESLDPTLATV